MLTPLEESFSDVHRQVGPKPACTQREGHGELLVDCFVPTALGRR